MKTGVYWTRHIAEAEKLTKPLAAALPEFQEDSSRKKFIAIDAAIEELLSFRIKLQELQKEAAKLRKGDKDKAEDILMDLHEHFDHIGNFHCEEARKATLALMKDIEEK